ncbi:MAG: class I SAM-dependent methyltransferase [Bacteroidia bacterium]|nr:class I SAM-dependent methyltransferase [Bacteroidia bacterium]
MKKLIFLLVPPVVWVVYRKLKFQFLKDSLRKELQEKIKIIHQLSDEQRGNKEIIENEVLPKLGLNGVTNYNFSIFPAELSEKLNSGLKVWQYPNQFAKLMSKMAVKKINTYLEIGMEHGGSFITMVEFLKIKKPNLTAYGVDYKISDSLKVYSELNKNVILWAMDSHSDAFKNKVKKMRSLDLVFIDGDHTYYGVEMDFNLVKDKATHIAFHDIVDFNCNGVRDFWAYLKEKYKNEYYFDECIDQYPEVLNNTGKTFLGIGLMTKKENETA